MSTKQQNDRFQQVIHQFASELDDLIKKYFIEECKMTFVLRDPREEDGIFLSDDNDLQKVIKQIYAAQNKQFEKRAR